MATTFPPVASAGKARAIANSSCCTTWSRHRHERAPLGVRRSRARFAREGGLMGHDCVDVDFACLG